MFKNIDLKGESDDVKNKKVQMKKPQHDYSQE